MKASDMQKMNSCIVFSSLGQMQEHLLSAKNGLGNGIKGSSIGRGSAEPPNPGNCNSKRICASHKPFSSHTYSMGDKLMKRAFAYDKY